MEIHRNVQKLQTKFHCNPLEQLYAVGLTKSTFVYYFCVENPKNQNLKYLFVKIHAR
jgi:hypothetical protein